MMWRSVPELESLSDEAIDAYVERHGASVFYRSAFLKQYARSPITCLDPAGALVRTADDEAIDAIVPLFVRSGRNPFADPDDPPRREVVSPMPHCYDAHFDPEWSQDPAFRDAMEHATRSRRCERVVVESITLPPSSTTTVNGRVDVAEGAPRYLLDPVPTADDYAARLSRSTRRSLRRHARRAADAGATRHRAVPRDAPVDDVIALCMDTAERKAPGYYRPEPLKRLIEATSDYCEILWIECDARTVGGTVCFTDRHTIHFWAGGVGAPDGEAWSWNYVLFAAELDAAFAARATRAEFGRRGDEFKRRHRLDARAMHRVTMDVGGRP